MPAPIMARPDFLRAPNRQGTIPSNISDAEQGYTRSVDPNELTSTHLNNLTASNSRYIRQARGSGAALASSRGLGNSSLAAANSEAAAIGAAAPIASEDAGAYRAAASENLQSLASQRLGNEQNATSIFNQIHGDTTSADIANNRNQFERETDIRRRGWDVEDQGLQDRRRQQDRDWSVDDRNFNERSVQRRNREGLAATTIQTIFNNPEYFRDPQGAAGTIQFYQDRWDEMFPYDGGTP